MAAEAAPAPADDAPRRFVPRGAVAAGRLTLRGDDAAVLFARDVRPGRRIVALDGSGWAYDVVVAEASPAWVDGAVVARRLAPGRRTRVSLYYSPLDAVATRELAVAAAAAGVVALTPVFSAASRVDMPAQGPDALARPVAEAAEAAGWGRAPVLGEVAFLDQAVDQAARAGAAVLLAVPDGPPPAAALDGRPFTVALFCPTAAPFTTDELARAAARGARPVAWDRALSAPAAAAAALAAIYAALDP